MFLTQIPSGTPRGSYLNQAIALYMQPVRAKLLRLFHNGFTQEWVRQSPELFGIETVLLANISPMSDNNPLALIAKEIETHSQTVNDVKKAKFIAALVAYTPITEENKTWRNQIRNIFVIEMSKNLLNQEVIEAGLRILTACPAENVSDDPETSALLCEILRTQSHSDSVIQVALEYVMKILHAATDHHILAMQKESKSNIFIEIASLLVTVPLAGIPLSVESVTRLATRGRALNVISVALSLSSEPAAFLNLRRDSSEKTIAQKAFGVLFAELMLENRYRHFLPLPETYTQTADIRVRRVRDAICILNRMSSLEASKSPLEEYSVLVPSLFGLVRSLLAKPSIETSAFDAIFQEMLRGDLVMIKELGTAQLAGTALEIEQSVWS